MDLRTLLPTTTNPKRDRRRIRALCVGAIVVMALLVSLASYAVAATASFPDVPATHPYHTAIVQLADRGVVGGYADGRFGPSDKVMRQQFAKMLVLAGGYPVSESDVCLFTDVEVSGPSGLYPDNYIAVAAKNGLTLGKTATAFDPYTFVSRYQVVTMLVRMLDNLKPGQLAAPPAGWSGSGWKNDALHGANAARAEYNGLLAGLDLGTLDPYGYMTRGEAAQVLYNAVVKLTPATTTTLPATSTTALSTTTTAAPTTTTSAATTSTSIAPTTTTTAPSYPPASDYSIAGLEPAQVVVTIRDQFGNVMPQQMVTLNSVALEGVLTNLMTNVVVGPTDENGNVAFSWTQSAGDWGVERVTASIGAYSSTVALIQWIYDDTTTDHIGATAGQQKVTVASGFTPWNGDQLNVYLGLTLGSLGHGTYVAANGLQMTTGHVWTAGEAFFVGATSTNTDGEPNWMYNLAH